MNAEAFLSKLEQADLAPAEIVASLRRQVAAAKEPITPAAIAKLLVDKGHLTAGQAQRLLDPPGASQITKKPAPAASPSTIQGASASQITKPASPSAIQKPAAAKPAKTTPPASSTSNSSILDDIGLAPEPGLSALSSSSSVHSSGLSSPGLSSPGLSSPGLSSPGLSSPGLAPSTSHVSKGSSKGAVTKPAALEVGLAPLDELPELPTAVTAAPTPAAKSTIQKAPAAKAPAPPAPKPKPAPVPVVETLDDLLPLDDLGSLGLDPLEDLSTIGSLDALMPVGSPDPLGGPLGTSSNVDPLGDPLGGPLGGPADLGALAAQTSAPTQQRSLPGATVSAAAGESRTTLWVGLGIGGTALLVVIVGLAVFFWPRGTGQLEFQAAEQAFQEKQYPAAIEKYDLLLRLHPRHEQASLVKVHRGLAMIHLANSSPPDWERLLPSVTNVTNQIAGEAELAQIHAELAPLLIKMTAALATMAKEEKSADQLPTRLNQAQTALGLCNDARLLPSTMRPWQQLAEIEESLKLLQREQQRNTVRDQFKATMSQSLTAINGDLSPVLKERNRLLARYPELAIDPMWNELGPAYAVAAAKCVKTTAERRAAEKDPVKTPILASVSWQLLNARLNENPPPAGEQLALVMAAGAVHALDAASGQPRWSRDLGCAAADRPLMATGGSSALLIDRRRNELLSVSATNGSLIWRQPLAQPAIGSPLLLDGKVYLALQPGKLQCFDAGSGELQAVAELPQLLLVAPSASADGKQLLQLADESLLYVLNAADLKCETVKYLGHEGGAVTLPPVVFQQQFVFASQRGDQTELQRFSLDAAKMDVKSQRLEGLLAAPLLVAGQRLIASTAQGKIHVLELSSDGSDPFKLVQTLAAPAGASVLRYVQPSEGGLLVADRGLAQLKFDAAGKLQPVWSAFPADLFDAAGQTHDQMLVSVRYVADQDALYAAAVNIADGQPLWQTALQLPLTLIADSQEGSRPLAIPATAVARLLGADEATVDLKAEFKTLLTQNAIQNLKALPITGVLATGDDRLLVPPFGSRELLFVHAQTQAVRKLKLPGQLAGLPAVSGQNLLVPLTDGSVQCLSIETGEVTAAPFVLPGSVASASEPVRVIALGTDGKAALVCSQAIVRINYQDQPKPHWAEQAADSSPAANFPNPLVAAEQGRVSWGPHPAGDGLLVATDRDLLVSFNAAGEKQWQHPLPAGRLAGSPVIQKNNVILTSSSGLIEVRSLATGDLVGSVDLQQSLPGNPLVSGNTLWLPTSSGQVIQVAIPTEKARP